MNNLADINDVYNVLLRIEELLIQFLQREIPKSCNHLFTEGPFFNGTNSYMACRFCGKKRQC